MAFIVAILKIISLVAAIWSAFNGANLKAKADAYNTQLVAAARDGSGGDQLTADAPTTFDWAATVLPGLLSVVAYGATAFFGKDSKAAVSVDQIRDLVERLGIGKAITPQPGKTDGQSPVTPIGPIDTSGDGASTLAKLQALAVLSGSANGLLGPFVSELWQSIAKHGLPKGFSLTLYYPQGLPYTLLSHPGLLCVHEPTDGQAGGDGEDDDGGHGDSDIKLAPRSPKPGPPVPSHN